MQIDNRHYNLDPKEVHGKDFPGGTFRVLQEKEIEQFGEYRTKRFVVEVWDLSGNIGRLEAKLLKTSRLARISLKVKTH